MKMTFYPNSIKEEENTLFMHCYLVRWLNTAIHTVMCHFINFMFCRIQIDWNLFEFFFVNHGEQPCTTHFQRFRCFISILIFCCCCVTANNVYVPKYSIRRTHSYQIKYQLKCCRQIHLKQKQKKKYKRQRRKLIKCLKVMHFIMTFFRTPTIFSYREYSISIYNLIHIYLILNKKNNIYKRTKIKNLVLLFYPRYFGVALLWKISIENGWILMDFAFEFAIERKKQKQKK